MPFPIELVGIEKQQFAGMDRGREEEPSASVEERRRVSERYALTQHLLELPPIREFSRAVELDRLVLGGFRQHQYLVALANQERIRNMVRRFEHRDGRGGTAVFPNLAHGDAASSRRRELLEEQKLTAVVLNHEWVGLFMA